MVLKTKYEDFTFKIPKEAEDYGQSSEFVIKAINEILKKAIDTKNNKVVINTNLKRGLPMENINKIAGPFMESWAQELFQEVLEDENNKYKLINVEDGERLHMADLILQFKREKKTPSAITANVDVKATSEDISSSGKSPNITSYARIRSAYIEDPDYMFIILSLKHKVFSEKDKERNLMNGIMEIVDFNAYDLKFISDKDISYNPALGTGQLQIRDIHYVKIIKRTTWDFCQLLDKKYIKSKKGFNSWVNLAKKCEWVKDE